MTVACPRQRRLPRSRSDARFETSPVDGPEQTFQAVACASFPDDEVHEPSGNGDLLDDLLACQQLLHPTIRLDQREQRVRPRAGVGNDRVPDPPVQLDDIVPLLVSARSASKIGHGAQASDCP